MHSMLWWNSHAFKMLVDSIMQGCSLFSPRLFLLHEQLHNDSQAAHTSCHKGNHDSLVMWFTCKSTN